MLKLKSSIAVLVLGLVVALFCGTSAQAQGWVKQFPWPSKANGIAADSTGIYVVGKMCISPCTAENYDMAIMGKYESNNGDSIWFKFWDEGPVAAKGVAIGPSGVYVIGKGSAGSFIRRYDVDGTNPITKPLSAGYSPTDIAVDSSGVYVVGTLPVTTMGRTLSLVSKFDASLNNDANFKLFTLQNLGNVSATGISVDNSGVYVVGYTDGALSGTSCIGIEDAFVAKCDKTYGDRVTSFGNNGVVQYGFPPFYNHAFARDVAVDSDNGGIYVAGDATGGLLAHTAFVEKRDPASGAVNWNTRFAPLRLMEIHAYGVSAYNGGVCVAGYLYGALSGNTSLGGYDAFIRNYNADGGLLLSEQFGTSGDDKVFGVSAVSTDPPAFYAAGSTTGIFPDQSSLGGETAFFAKLPGAPRPMAAFSTLFGIIEAMQLNSGIQSSLFAKLSAAQNTVTAISPSQTSASRINTVQVKGANRQNAVNQMQAFINECEAQSGKKLTEEQAILLIQKANEIIDLINSSPR
jgi:hypothetical protein